MKRRLMLVLAPAALALATLAQAQPAEPPSGPHGRQPSPEMQARHEAMQKQHLEDLKTVLRLRPDQEPALAAFVEAHKRQLGHMKRPHEPKALTTPQRLDEMAAHEAEMNTQRERMRQALTKFYAALSPEQQKVFDALQRLKGPHGGRTMVRHGGPAGGGERMVMRRHGGPDGSTPDHEPPR